MLFIKGFQVKIDFGFLLSIAKKIKKKFDNNIPLSHCSTRFFKLLCINNS